jgi:uncharacterized cupredoxin-like copper-binding protein
MFAKLIVPSAVAILALAGCGSSSKPSAGPTGGSPAASISSPAVPASRFSATVKEFGIAVAPAAVHSGHVAVAVHNAGKIPHEFVVFRTALAPTALPQLADGSKIDEKGKGITHLDPEAEDIQPGTTKSITVVLTPGRYVVVCNLPGHYKAGMHAVLTVS